MELEQPGKPRLLRVVTRCASAQDFLVTFGPFVKDGSIFIGTRSPRPIGQRQPCMIVLKDGRVLIRGEAEVVSVHTANEGPEGHAGMRIKFVQLDEPSKRVHADLIEHARILQDEDDKTPLLPVLPDKKIEPPSTPGARKPRSPTLLGMPQIPLPAEAGSETSGPIPANPLAPMEDSALGNFVEVAIYEETSRYRLAPDDGSAEDPIAAAPVQRAPTPPPMRAVTPPGVNRMTTTPKNDTKVDTKPLRKLDAKELRPDSKGGPKLGASTSEPKQLDTKPLPKIEQKPEPKIIVEGIDKPSKLEDTIEARRGALGLKPQPMSKPEPHLPPASVAAPPLPDLPTPIANTGIPLPIGAAAEPFPEPPPIPRAVPEFDTTMVSGPVVMSPPPKEAPLKIPVPVMPSPQAAVAAPPPMPGVPPPVADAPAADTVPDPSLVPEEIASMSTERMAAPHLMQAAAPLPFGMGESEFVARHPRVPLVAYTTGAFLLGLGVGWLLFHGGERPAAPPAAPVANAPATTTAPPSVPGPAPSPAPPEAAPPDREPDSNSPVPALSGPGLELESTPSGATFFINGKKVGKAPLTLPMKKGKRLKISATKNGYKRWYRVMWHVNDITKVRAKMERP